MIEQCFKSQDKTWYKMVAEETEDGKVFWHFMMLQTKQDKQYWYVINTAETNNVAILDNEKQLKKAMYRRMAQLIK